MKNKRALSVLIFGLMFLLISAKEHRHVLVLHSYFPAQGWAYEANLGLRTAFQNQTDLYITLDIRYLDLRSEINQEKVNRLKKELRLSYPDNDSIDLIMAVDDYAWKFINDPEDMLFAQTPTIFCSAKDYRSTAANGRPFSGLNESLSFEENVHLIKQMLPRTNEVLFMCSENLPTGKGHLKELDELPKLIEGVKINVWRDSTSYSLKTVLRDLSPNAVVFFGITSFIDDPVLDMEINLHDWSFFNQFSEMTLFTHNYDLLDKGVLGGYMIKAYDTGFEAAQMALEYLRGKPMHLMPVRLMKSRYLGINYKVAKKFEISDSRIPKNADVINFEPSIWVNYRGLLFLILLSTLSLLGVVVFLWERRNELKKQLKQRNEDFETIEHQWLLNKATFTFLKKEMMLPISAIVGLRKMSKNPTSSSEEKEQYATIIQDHALQIRSVFDDLDALSTDAPEAIDINNKTFNHHFLIKELYEYALILRNEQHVTNLSISLNIPENSSTSVTTDPLRLKQFFIHLLHTLVNTEAHGILEIGYLQEEGRILFFLKENCLGLDKKEYAIATQAQSAHKKGSILFERLKTLNIESSHLSQKINGQYSLTPNENGGCSFNIVIPL